MGPHREICRSRSLGRQKEWVTRWQALPEREVLRPMHGRGLRRHKWSSEPPLVVYIDKYVLPGDFR